LFLKNLWRSVAVLWVDVGSDSAEVPPHYIQLIPFKSFQLFNGSILRAASGQAKLTMSGIYRSTVALRSSRLTARGQLGRNWRYCTGITGALTREAWGKDKSRERDRGGGILVFVIS